MDVAPCIIYHINSYYILYCINLYHTLPTTMSPNKLEIHQFPIIQSQNCWHHRESIGKASLFVSANSPNTTRDSWGFYPYFSIPRAGSRLLVESLVMNYLYGTVSKLFCNQYESVQKKLQIDSINSTIWTSEEVKDIHKLLNSKWESEWKYPRKKK